MSVFVTVLTAFGSGVLGACLGAMPSVIMCGVAVCIGMVGAVSGSGFNWLTDMAFGMFLGPQVSFAPACVAAAQQAAWPEQTTDASIAGGTLSIRILMPYTTDNRRNISKELLTKSRSGVLMSRWTGAKRVRTAARNSEISNFRQRL